MFGGKRPAGAPTPTTEFMFFWTHYWGKQKAPAGAPTPETDLLTIEIDVIWAARPRYDLILSQIDAKPPKEAL